MRYVAQFLLVLFCVVLTPIVLLSATIKFQLLNFRFWQESFAKNNVYQALAVSTKGFIESQIVTEGGSKNDAKVLTDLITQGNVKDFLDRNIQNILGFANGKSTQIIVYIPLKILPKNLLPAKLGVQSEMPLGEFLTKFNYQGYSSLPLASLSQAGKFSSYIFFGSAALAALFLVLSIILVRDRARFIAPGMAFIMSGLLTISVAKAFGIIKSLQSASQGNSSFAFNIAGVVLPPIVNEFTKAWYIIGAGLIIFGSILFFVRKPGYNNAK